MTKPSGRTPRRRHERKRPQRYILRVLSEGKVTEPSYLSAWARRNRQSVGIKLDDTGMTPDALVHRAKQYLKDRRPRRADPDFDEIWCVFDKDAHPNLAQAINEAGQSEIEVVVSNPCFELWLVLHAREQTAWIDRHAVQRLASTLGLADGKRIPVTARQALVEGFETARQRARALDERHAGNGSPPRENPSTDVWRLVDRLRNVPEAVLA